MERSPWRSGTPKTGRVPLSSTPRNQINSIGYGGNTLSCVTLCVSICVVCEATGSVLSLLLDCSTRRELFGKALHFRQAVPKTDL